MDQSLLLILTIFVVISGISLLGQFVALIAIYRVAKQMQQRTVELMPKVQTLLETSQHTVEQSKQQILDITAKTNALLDSGKVQMAKVEELLSDATSRAKSQMDRAEMVIDDTMSRAHETVSMVQGGILRPLREIQGVTAGVRAALSYLTRGTRPSVDRATHDEEMFI